MAKTPEFITGVCRQWLISPKGEIEGVLLAVKGTVVQVAADPASGAVLRRATAPGKRLRVLALPDHSPKTAAAAHPVYRFSSFADAAGQACEAPGTDPTKAVRKGVVASLHFAKHGEPNGVVLETGEFIHLRPHGMALLGLGVGAEVRAVGTLRMTALGTLMLEASQVNRIVIDPQAA
jgi:hypothetical protein